VLGYHEDYDGGDGLIVALGDEDRGRLGRFIKVG
jgi:hypothetical protein